MGARGQVLQVHRLPAEHAKKIKKKQAVRVENCTSCFFVCSPLGRSPLQVHGGDVEHHSFEPEDHEEPLGEGAVPDALSVAARLHSNATHQISQR